jgi:hypothetical protein
MLVPEWFMHTVVIAGLTVSAALILCGIVV